MANTGAQTSTTTSPDNVDQQLRELLDKAPGCVTSPEETQGPYYFDVDSIRRDITEGRPGLPLELMIRVQKAEGCVIGSSENPVENAAVEIWHCDAGGVYSGFEVSSQSANQGGAGGPNGNSGGGGPGESRQAVNHQQVIRPVVDLAKHLEELCPTAAMPQATKRHLPPTKGRICVARR